MMTFTFRFSFIYFMLPALPSPSQPPSPILKIYEISYENILEITSHYYTKFRSIYIENMGKLGEII
jgi:hypothetical protein